MKHGLISFGVVGLVIYLASAFAAASFDITQWHVIGRIIAGVFWLIASPIAYVITKDSDSIFHV